MLLVNDYYKEQSEIEQRGSTPEGLTGMLLALDWAKTRAQIPNLVWTLKVRLSLQGVFLGQWIQRMILVDTGQ